MTNGIREASPFFLYARVYNGKLGSQSFLVDLVKPILIKLLIF